MHLDKIDIAIINSLMQDGRKSFRQIARETKVSTPTVESRFSRMKGSGMIRNVVPVFNPDRIESQMSALIYLKTNPSLSIDIANRLALLPEVKNVYVMTGEHNLIVKVIADSPERAEEFVRKKLSAIKGIRTVSSQIIAKTMKEEQSVPLKEGVGVRIKCDYCDNEVSRTAKSLQVGDLQRYFCCNSCLVLYKQKYRGRIEAIANKRS
ncbi:MAG: Lrp/AsnC ligand binding domain-containing protein [Nitrososphaera sp.]